jgi:phenylacetate 2-hydroxylase
MLKVMCRQDYVPLLRIFPSQSKEAVSFRERRDVYMDRLLNELKERIAKGTDKPCITGNIIKDPEAKLSEGKLSSLFPTTSARTNPLPSRT